jgi:hypothetical protein
MKRQGFTKPDPKDFAEIERTHGPLAVDASDEQAAYRYQLATAAKLIRLFRASMRAGQNRGA